MSPVCNLAVERMRYPWRDLRLYRAWSCRTRRPAAADAAGARACGGCGSAVQHTGAPGAGTRVAACFHHATAGSDDAGIQAAADKTAAACCDRLSEWLAGGGVPDAAEQHLLLQALGPLQEVLNEEHRRELFCKLPFALLRVRTRLYWTRSLLHSTSQVVVISACCGPYSSSSCASYPC